MLKSPIRGQQNKERPGLPTGVKMENCFLYENFCILRIVCGIDN